jgi:hypothetical protein
MRRETVSRLLLLALGLAGAPARADPDDIHGRLEFEDAGLSARADSVDAGLGITDRDDGLGNLRFTWEPSRDGWSLSVHSLVTFESGGDVRLMRAEAGLLPTPPTTWFDLTDRFVDHGELLGTAGIDRLEAAYTAPDFVLRIGRQALSWGSGLVFRPMDLFDPFSPSATDTEYKPGTDMLYTQFLFADDGDLQVIAVPRPARSGGAPTEDASSLALHLQDTIAGHQVTGLLARDYGDWVGALGINGAIGGATWNLETVPTFLRTGPTRVSALANISDAVTLLDRNATIFAEYFRNGFGVDGRHFALNQLPPDLTARLARGQVFDTRRDELAAGLILEVSPLFTITPTLIEDLDDASAFALVAATYSLGDDLSLVAGAQLPIGPTRTEFGGIVLSSGNPTVLAPPTQLYLQLRRYF